MWNKVERIRGQVDIPLNEMGLAQAEATGQRIAAEWTLAAIYCSPLQRAVQTAEAIARHQLNLTPQACEGINDLNFGVWQGLEPQAVEKEWPEMARTWLTDPHQVAFPQGESLDRLRTRAMNALYQIIDAHPGQDVAVVAHTVVNRVILLAMLQLDNSHYWRIGQDTCAINVARWQHDAFYIDAVNDTCHLRALS